MKQGSNRRPRPRGNSNSNKSRPSGRHSYDSNGPGGKVRGTAQQVLEKYQALGYDATSSGDRIAAESFFQFAEHYYRIVHADGANQPNQPNQPSQANGPQFGGNPEQTPPSAAPARETVPEASPELPASVTGHGNEAAKPAARVTRIKADVAPSEPQPALADSGGDEPEIIRKAPRRRRARAKTEVSDVVNTETVDS